MSRTIICMVSSFVMVSFVSTVRGQAEPFSLATFEDITIDNGPRYGQNAGANGSGIEARDIATRRHVFLVSYDISALKAQGQFFSDVSFSLYSFNLNGETNVYGVIEPLNLLNVESLSWATAPGVKNNPLPVLDTSVVQNLDMNDLTDVLVTFSGPGTAGQRFSTDTSEALADFINSDTDGILTFLFAPAAEGNQLIVRSRELAEGGTFLEGLVGGTPTSASRPVPESETADVYRDQVLSWKAGEFAVTHDVYLGASFEDVNAATREAPMGVLVAMDHGDSSFNAGRLSLGETYYWKVNEVNGTPDFTIYPGAVWSFTVEARSYPIPGDSITATASSVNSAIFAAENAVNGAGLEGDLHSNVDGMWLSASPDPAPTLQCDFDKAYLLDVMAVWNSNQSSESAIGWGAKDVLIEYSLDGMTWTALDGVPQFARASGLDGIPPTDTIDFGGAAAQHVRITINSNWGDIVQQSGLSELRFFAIPTSARNPNPADGASDVAPDATFSWRPGRQADQHQVFLGSDETAVTDGSAESLLSTESSLALSPYDLTLDQTYYLRVDEVNDAGAVPVWMGDTWTFTVSAFLVVDDFEGYRANDPEDPAAIFNVWVDGFIDDNNGSQVGNDTSPFAERVTAMGTQSMPFFYGQGGAASSQATRTFSPGQDWTRSGVASLAISFYGAEGNTGQLFAIVNGTRFDYDGDAANLALADWTTWSIDLTGVGGLQNVSSLSIGVENGSGTLFFDDIQLRP